LPETVEDKMSAATARSERHADPHDDNESYAEREARASRVAAKQDLVLRRSGIDCGVSSSNRFDLLYQRYNQPVGLNLRLEDVEVWLGIRVI
jgi:hypothetical protein